MTMYTKRDHYVREIDFEIQAQTEEKKSNFSEIKIFSLNFAEGILKCRVPLYNPKKFVIVETML